MMSGNCKPNSRKIRPLKANSSNDKTLRLSRRVLVWRGSRSSQLCIIPAATADRMPDAPTRSASTYAANGSNNMNTTWVAGSSQPRAIIQVRRRPISQLRATPTARPPRATRTKLKLASVSENTPVIAATKANLKVTRPEASFIRASPCSMCISGVGRRSWVIAETATASVGDKTAARAKATGSGMLGSSQ
ncbi:hypothetical protein D9M71_368330 [compost metagenome]